MVGGNHQLSALSELVNKAPEAIRLQDGSFSFQFAGGIGHLYNIEYSPDLTPGSWQVIYEAPAISASPVAVSIPVQSGEKGFYRVAWVP